ncbi:MAG: mycofactocin-coupled SDR family oxidoreductase [Mycobacterium sp.]
MGALDGKVVFITGVARGQGRSHAVRLSGLGADIIGVDICADDPSIDYPNASRADLDETVALVEKQGRRLLASVADVRDPTAVRKAVDEGVEELGRLDIVLANAGIVRYDGDPDFETGFQIWSDILATNLTGCYNTAMATIPHLIQGGRGGSIVFTGSVGGLRPTKSLGSSQLAYQASKAALQTMTKQLAATLAEHMIRVNVVNPTGVVSGMTQNEALRKRHAEASQGTDNVVSSMVNAMPVPMLDPEDISNAIEYLVTDAGRYVTGIPLTVDAGFCVN